MQVFKQLQSPSQLIKPVILTIGNYDGVHLGHQKVLQRVAELANESVLITFDPPPDVVLFPDKPIERLCSQEKKLELLKRYGIDILYLLTFTKRFSEQSAEEFLKNIYAIIPFSHLILGYDAKFGKNREGDPSQVEMIAKKMGFVVEYVTPYTLDNQPISSSRIRNAIHEGQLDIVEQMLGRPYSITSHVIEGKGQGKRIGYPTANINVTGLCLPPLGVWAVNVLSKGKSHQGIANLGFAPTVRHDHHPLLEVHLFDHEAILYGEELEVFFQKYIRPEKQFSSLEELKEQIDKDVTIARQT